MLLLLKWVTGLRRSLCDSSYISRAKVATIDTVVYSSQIVSPPSKWWLSSEPPHAHARAMLTQATRPSVLARTRPFNPCTCPYVLECFALPAFVKQSVVQSVVDPSASHRCCRRAVVSPVSRGATSTTNTNTQRRECAADVLAHQATHTPAADQAQMPEKHRKKTCLCAAIACSGASTVDACS